MVIIDDGIRLNARLELPAHAEGKHPVAVIIHGFTGHMEEKHLEAVSAALNALGCATLRVDMYGHGKSEGRFHDHTLYKWLTNAMTVIDYARALPFATEVYLCGHSQGGLTAILAGALKHDVISGIIALSPACMIPDLARKGGLLGTSFDPDRIPDELKVWNDWTLGSNYVRVAQTIHVEEAVDRFTGPVLVVQGGADDPALIRSAAAAAERYKNARLVMIENETHCYDNHPEKMTEAVADWMRERLK